MENLFPYKAIEKLFKYNGKTYNSVLVPELCFEDDALDFTGSYHCILIRPDKGTITFDLIPDSFSKWQTEPSGIDPGIIDELDIIITEYRK